jgi:hypothetical protein
MYEEEGGDGPIRYGKDQCTLKEILDKLLVNNISPQDYEKVNISINWASRCSDPTISVSIKIPKTSEEINKEMVEQQKLIDEKKASLVESRTIRQKKKEEKQKLINSLSEEQKALLGIK